jgi:membrane protein DedA with SNARE-associated domain
VIEWIGSLPLVPAIGLLWVVVLCRAGGTYLVGRGAHRLAHRGRLARLIESPSVERAIGIVNRCGAPVVALSFLTVGFQTAANLSAGLTRMPVIRYLPALLIGGLAWAVIYATVGLAVVVAWIQLFLLSPWVALLVLALVIALVVGLVLRRRRRRSVSGPSAEQVTTEVLATEIAEGATARRGDGPTTDGSAGRDER